MVATASVYSPCRLVLLVALLCPVVGLAEGDADDRALGSFDLTEFRFARVEYDSVGGWGQAFYSFEGRIWDRWETDYPQAEQNFGKRLSQLTRVFAGTQPARRRLTAPDLGDFPMLFMSDVGYMDYSADEVRAMRDYLGNGGFVWVDDFWGDAEWGSFERFMREVLPGKRWQVVPISHEVFKTVFDIDEMPQIPARTFARGFFGSRTAEPAGMHRQPSGSLETATMRGWFDEDGRLMVIGTHNTDVADGWEREAYGQWYFERFSTRSYRLGVNVVTYVLTH
ncbi:MAG: transmembrane prediction [Gammaproteobacteria bacterium]|nr:transmembrane prediction [Gammaproteobacteria bacterium]